MAHGGIEKYYNPANKVVNDGDTAFADDLNSINYAVDTALAQVADDLDVMDVKVNTFSAEAESWANNDQGVPPDPLESAKFSSKAYATESKEYAIQAKGVPIHKADGTTQLIDSALVSATKAAASQAAALASKNAAALSESNAEGHSLQARADQQVGFESMQDAQAAASAANASANLAAASAANLPNATTAGADKILVTNSSGDGWDYIAATGELVFRDANGTAKFGAPTDPEHPVRLGDTSLRENVKVTVGAGGDFATINAAVLHLSRFTPDLGVTAEVELQSGFVMMEQLFVEGLDLGWITITGVDAETVINEPSLTRVLFEAHKPAFGVINGTLPTIGQLFSFSSKGSAVNIRSGVIANKVGRANILPGCGVKNAGLFGIHAIGGSTINAQGANASIAGSDGIYATSGSTVNADGANAGGAWQYGIVAGKRATINAAGANASGAGVGGFVVLSGSIISAHGATGTLSQAKNTVTANGIIFQ